MRIPIYKVRNDDNPLDPWCPRAMTLTQFTDAGDDETYDLCRPLACGESVTVGGGAGVQFSIKRIR